jgi:hypothetical protein
MYIVSDTEHNRTEYSENRKRRVFRSNYTQMGACIHACWHSVDSSTGQAYSHRGNQVYLHVFAKPHVTYTCFNSLHPECVHENELTPRLHGPMQTCLIENTMEWAVLCDPVQFSRQVQKTSTRTYSLRLQNLQQYHCREFPISHYKSLLEHHVLSTDTRLGCVGSHGHRKLGNY